MSVTRTLMRSYLKDVLFRDGVSDKPPLLLNLETGVVVLC